MKCSHCNKTSTGSYGWRSKELNYIVTNEACDEHKTNAIRLREHVAKETQEPTSQNQIKK